MTLPICKARWVPVRYPAQVRDEDNPDYEQAQKRKDQMWELIHKLLEYSQYSHPIYEAKIDG